MGQNNSQPKSGNLLLPEAECELNWAHSCMQGKRETMEDKYSVSESNDDAIFSLFDGHYGPKAAIYAGNNLHDVIISRPELKESNYPLTLMQAYLQLDENLLEKSRQEGWHDGTTAITAITGITTNKNQKKINRLYIANSGDCRAIASYIDGKTYRLTVDHNPTLKSERERIKKAGGVIKFGRIESKLSVSRGFGDRQFKEPKRLVETKPDIISIKISPELRTVIIACDGVWGWLSDLQVASFVSRGLRQGNRVDVVARDLVKYAYDSGSTDNISVLLLYFNPSTVPREVTALKWRAEQYVVEVPRMIEKVVKKYVYDNENQEISESSSSDSEEKSVDFRETHNHVDTADTSKKFLSKSSNNDIIKDGQADKNVETEVGCKSSPILSSISKDKYSKEDPIYSAHRKFGNLNRSNADLQENSTTNDGKSIGFRSQASKKRIKKLKYRTLNDIQKSNSPKPEILQKPTSKTMRNIKNS